MNTDFDNLIAVARDYCQLVEGAQDSDSEWLSQVAGMLPRLHAAIVDVNGRPPERSDNYLMPDLEARFEMYTFLRDLLGERDGYWMEFDVANDGQGMSGSLADDITDIYCELKHGLRQIDAGLQDSCTALDNWRLGYHMHWGRHLVDAERHLYELGARNQLIL